MSELKDYITNALHDLKESIEDIQPGNVAHKKANILSTLFAISKSVEIKESKVEKENEELKEAIKHILLEGTHSLPSIVENMVLEAGCAGEDCEYQFFNGCDYCPIAYKKENEERKPVSTEEIVKITKFINGIELKENQSE